MIPPPRPSTRRILQEKQEDFQDRVVLNFLVELGYIDIKKEPDCGSGKADYLVRHNGGEYFVEAHSPDLEKQGIDDLDTIDKVQSLVDLIGRQAMRELPEIYQDCFLDGECDGLLGREVQGSEVLRGIIDKIRPWKDRIAELPAFNTEEAWHYRQYESWPEEALFERYGITIPYAHGSLSVSHTDRNAKQRHWRLAWRLLRRHERYGPSVWRCMFGGDGGRPESHNMANGISKKADKHRKRIRKDPELERMPFVIFMDGRAFLGSEGRYEFFELEAALIRDYKWRPGAPDAVVIVGTWGVPRGTDSSVLEERAEHSGDVMFNPCSYGPGRSYPICLNPLLLNRRMIRLWRVGTHLISAG